MNIGDIVFVPNCLPDMLRDVLMEEAGLKHKWKLS